MPYTDDFDGDDVYYKIYKVKDTGQLTVVCMQWFDEYDYKEDLFFTDEDGDHLKFFSEKEAQQWLIDNVHSHLIDPEYRAVYINRNDYLKESE